MIKEWFLKAWIKQARWCICRFGYLCLCVHICVCVSSGNPGSTVSAQRFHGKRQLRGNTGLPGWLKRSYITGSDMLVNLNMSAKEEKNLFLWSFEREKGQPELFEDLHRCIFTFLWADERCRPTIYWTSRLYCQVMTDVQTIHVTTARCWLVPPCWVIAHTLDQQ